ncbi:MAG: recombinase family protein [Gammaproteobacteria bacterium]|nr:recombinase family protein [Gammaproteobacteria bacterium]
MNKIAADHLTRRAYVYIRQSTLDQVQNNRESQRRQYALADRARELGWQDVEVIDDDLGRSGSGVKRPGFERLLGGLCDGRVGAVFCVEASRLARNGRDWHTLLEFCSVVGALLIDAEGVYDPRDPNDRLLLGMKGRISEMELANFRARAQAALAQKAKRGELIQRVAVGYVRTEERLEKTPDVRVREALDLVFRKFNEFGSARRLYFWLSTENIQLPTVTDGTGRIVRWQTPRYHSLLSLLQNPVYAGAYAYGRTRTRVHLAHGRKQVSRTKHRAPADWRVLITDHHEGYIGWDEYQRIQTLIAHNAVSRGDAVRGAVRSGHALLVGLLRCGHCGRKLHVEYPSQGRIRYACMSSRLDPNGVCCVRTNGRQTDALVGEELLRCLAPLGIEAAVGALQTQRSTEDDRIKQKSLAIEQARYEVARAQRQYDAVDATNRLVAAELERRWNAALRAQADLEEELAALRKERPACLSEEQRRTLLGLGADLRRLWEHPQGQPEWKKRIVRTVITEIVVSTDGAEVQLLLHWRGGDHTRLRFEKVRRGQHRFATDTGTVELVRGLARLQPDAMIASVLNRIGRRTAHGERWSARSICSLRHRHAIDVFVLGEWRSRAEITLDEAAAMLKVNATTVMKWIRAGRLPAAQLCPHAPWVLRQSDVENFNAIPVQAASSQGANAEQLALTIQ